jgi:hypothetical protein
MDSQVGEPEHPPGDCAKQLSRQVVSVPHASWQHVEKQVPSLPHVELQQEPVQLVMQFS